MITIRRVILDRYRYKCNPLYSLLVSLGLSTFTSYFFSAGNLTRLALLSVNVSIEQQKAVHILMVYTTHYLGESLFVFSDSRLWEYPV